ncbi:hypothetical protein CIB48_g6255 [Xylaria polymorpha]|nr:hypothetical protein CIB48_g6255 [Xylaria polymorpha]
MLNPRQYVDTIESIGKSVPVDLWMGGAGGAGQADEEYNTKYGLPDLLADCSIGPFGSHPCGKADFVQELYLKELKAYKPAPVKDSDSVGQVQTFSVPSTPKSPEETDLATSLKEYESMAVEVEGNEGATTSSTPAVVEDWLVEEEEEEGGAHH